ncbi:MAG: formamidopyrimidine-DNA glycosylase [Planctomycetes bacterium]|nr:formamidopyrimidine-DNA glycosylase [Planctomycetota bacterium]
MPELPDVAIYVERLARRVVGTRLLRVRVKSPFLLRSVDPPLSEFEGSVVRDVLRLGKRIVFAFDGESFLVLHLMIAGRLRWRAPGAAIPATIGLAAFDFESGTLLFTEASKKKRASLHAVRGEHALAAHDRGGLEPLVCTPAEFAERLRLENHTLKRALTDPTLFSGIGNAYSDEILHRARLSPVTHTQKLDDDAVERLFQATRTTLTEWIERTRAELGDGFPEDVTAFRPQMAVHGKFGKPCPDCGAKVQRIVYAENESNYCPTCQTGGKLLADRALSRLLRGDWPKTAEELEERKKG